MFLEAAL